MNPMNLPPVILDYDEIDSLRVWVDDRYAVAPTPRGEWVVEDHQPADGSGITICPVSNQFFATKEAAWEFAIR